MFKKFLIILIVLPALGFSQTFTLKSPDVYALKKELDRDNSKEIIYTYLFQEYKKIGKKKNIKKYEYNQDEICAFEQEFYGGITYTIDQCPEEGGMNYNIKFPKTDRKTLIDWVELMDNNDLSDVENSWNKNNYRPTDEGVGCYYTIKETETNSIVEVWCGC